MRGDRLKVDASRELLLPAKPNHRVGRGIRWYARRLVRKRFHAVRIDPALPAILSSLESADRPAIVLMTHSSWWDPIVGILLWDRFYPERPIAGPMHRRELERFGFFRSIGVFGIEPDDPASLAAMREYVLPRMRRDGGRSGEVLMLTPQGSLADARAPIAIRPGAASIAAAFESIDVVALAIEYGFWVDQRPEIFLRAERCEPMARDRRASTADWHRAMQDSMRRSAASLADAVISRDPDRFEVLAGAGTSVHPVYDAWLRLIGRSGSIDGDGRSRRESATKAASR
ncbi:MAG: lysophospholipid acyltransferase family protein [Phycisphaerales bacterium]